VPLHRGLVLLRAQQLTLLGFVDAERRDVGRRRRSQSRPPSLILSNGAWRRGAAAWITGPSLFASRLKEPHQAAACRRRSEVLDAVVSWIRRRHEGSLGGVARSACNFPAAGEGRALTSTEGEAGRGGEGEAQAATAAPATETATTWPNRFEFSFLVRTHVVVTSHRPAQICFKTHDDDADPTDSSRSTSNCAGSSPCVVN
jgi:hypothetical protein